MSEFIKKYWFTLPLVILVTLIYIWFVSAGTWIKWVSATHLYDDLARGFLKGNLYLPTKVNFKPLPIANPNDNSVGLKPSGPLDVSYFAGKYYIYWGPAPAILLLLIHTIISRIVGDLQLVFVFLTVVFILQCLLAVAIWDRFFRDLPKYILWLSIMLMGLAGPATFMLDSTRSARIYEAAITGGQLFLVSGFIVLLTALRPPISQWRFACAGILWACAIGTRLILAVPIGFMVLMAGWWNLSVNHRSFKKIADLMPVCLPLAIGLVCLGWYNWARFGSVTESGFYYAMTTIPNFQQHSSELIKPIFIPQNIYNYFLYPFSIQAEFPYLYAEYGNPRAIFSFYPLPSFYSTQIITGLVYTVPFLVFAILPPVTLLNNFFSKRVLPFQGSEGDRNILNWMVLTISGSSMLTLGILLSYFWAAERYIYDVMPLLVMLGIIGFWQGYQLLSNKPVWRRIYTGIGIGLIAASILMSTLVALSVNYVRFDVIHLLSSTR